jgi:hypothetical protein
MRPLEHVEELGQLVERGAAQEAAQRGDASSSRGRLAHDGAVLLDRHRAELPHDDLLAVEP